MSKINVSFDTVSKEMTATLASAAPSMGVDIYPSYDDPDEYRCCVTTSTKDEDNDMRMMTQLVASESNRAKASKEAPSDKFPAFVQIKETVSAAARDIAAYFKC